MENENQDTIALLGNCVDVDKKGGCDSQKQKVSVESTEMRKWQRYMDEVKKWEDSRLPLAGGCMK
jgi:hypothetical protein